MRVLDVLVDLPADLGERLALDLAPARRVGLGADELDDLGGLGRDLLGAQVVKQPHGLAGGLCPGLLAIDRVGGHVGARNDVTEEHSLCARAGRLLAAEDAQRERGEPLFEIGVILEEIAELDVEGFDRVEFALVLLCELAERLVVIVWLEEFAVLDAERV